MKQNNSIGYLWAGMLKLRGFKLRKAVRLLTKASELGSGLASLYLATIAREMIPDSALILAYL